MGRPPRTTPGSTSSTPEAPKTAPPAVVGDLSPEILAAYERSLPGSGWALLQLTSRIADSRISDRRLGKIFALVAFLSVVAAAVACVAMGSQFVAAAFVGAGIMSAITGAFVSS